MFASDPAPDHDPTSAPAVASASLVARYVVRARRRADLSQRELAQVLGVSQSTVSRIEQATAPVEADTFIAILALAGLRFRVTDEAGNDVQPVSVDTVRDNAGRRFPAHLDVGPPDVLTREQINSPRYDRLPPRGRYHRRPQRDQVRALAPMFKREALAIGRPDATTDHPTGTGLARRATLMRGRQPMITPAPQPEIECECLLACFEQACLEQCPCQCEPLRQTDWRARPGRGPSADAGAYLVQLRKEGEIEGAAQKVDPT